MYVREVDCILCELSSIHPSAAVLCSGAKDLILELVGSAEPLTAEITAEVDAGTAVWFLHTGSCCLHWLPLCQIPAVPWEAPTSSFQILHLQNTLFLQIKA